MINIGTRKNFFILDDVAGFYRYTNHFNHIELLSKACYCKANFTKYANKKGKIARKYWSFFSPSFLQSIRYINIVQAKICKEFPILPHRICLYLTCWGWRDYAKNPIKRTFFSRFRLLLIFGWCFWSLELAVKPLNRNSNNSYKLAQNISIAVMHIE